MTKDNANGRATPSGSLRGAGSFILGVLLSAFGALWAFMLVNMVTLWVYRDNYIDAELEVVKYHYIDSNVGRKSRGRSRSGTSSESVHQIEGVLHPGGATIYTNDRDIRVTIFDAEDAVVGRQPLRQEVEGKRYKVKHWPDHERRWYEPPTTFTGGFPSTKQLVVCLTVLLVLWGGGPALIFRGNRLQRRSGPERSGPGYWPSWTGLVAVLAAIFWTFFAIFVNGILPSRKLNKLGTAVLERSTQELAVGYGFAALMGIVGLGLLWLLACAARQRLQSRDGSRAN